MLTTRLKTFPGYADMSIASLRLGLVHQDMPFARRNTPCGNDMIDAHVENLMDSKLPTGFPQSLGKVFDFPTIIWITASQLPTFPQGLLPLIFLY